MNGHGRFLSPNSLLSLIYPVPPFLSVKDTRPYLLFLSPTKFCLIPLGLLILYYYPSSRLPLPRRLRKGSSRCSFSGVLLVVGTPVAQPSCSFLQSCLVYPHVCSDLSRRGVRMFPQVESCSSGSFEPQPPRPPKPHLPHKSPLPPTLCTLALTPSHSRSHSIPIRTPRRPILQLLRECVLSESYKTSSTLTDKSRPPKQNLPPSYPELPATYVHGWRPHLDLKLTNEKKSTTSHSSAEGDCYRAHVFRTLFTSKSLL